jgi:hypothetical protein
MFSGKLINFEDSILKIKYFQKTVHKKLFFKKIKFENFSISKNNIIYAKAAKVLWYMSLA